MQLPVSFINEIVFSLFCVVYMFTHDIPKYFLFIVYQKDYLSMTLSCDGNIVRHTDVMASIAIDPMQLYLDFIEYQQCCLRYEMLQ